MNEPSIRRVLRADAVVSLALGALLLLGSSDRLYRALDLPQARPALLVQVGGALLWGFAYLLWVAPRAPELTRHVAVAAALAHALGVVLLAFWLLVLGPAELGVGRLGGALLGAAALTLAALAAAEARIAAALSAPG